MEKNENTLDFYEKMMKYEDKENQVTEKRIKKEYDHVIKHSRRRGSQISLQFKHFIYLYKF